ncbi:hypothetical protein MMC21_004358 [Puttea exsequens]|nr:hypothetical protein [Puttea exsequens]
MASSNTKTSVPRDYTTPNFPSLYWLIGPGDVVKPRYLYHIRDIWRFTLFWTILVYEAAHLAVAFYAIAIIWYGGRGGMKPATRMSKGKKEEVEGDKGDGNRNERVLEKLKVLWMVPVVYAFVAGVEAVLAGSVVGLILGAVYNAGGFKMSTWIPFVWSIVNILVLILSSFSIQGGL